MLVLRRRPNEAITLKTAGGTPIAAIRVLSVEGDRCKIGIDAPPDVIVLREELENPNIAAEKPQMLWCDMCNRAYGPNRMCEHMEIVEVTR